MEEAVQLAIASIPAYVDASDMFCVLCPPLPHSHTNVMCGRETWARRGWCRLELAAASFTQREKPLVMVNSSTDGCLMNLVEPLYDAPGNGDFTEESDKAKLLPVMEALISDHLEALWKIPEKVVRARLLAANHGRLVRGLGSLARRVPRAWRSSSRRSTSRLPLGLLRAASGPCIVLR